MSPDHAILTPEERDELELTALSRPRLQEQFRNLEQQHECAALGMWVFLATEALFFGVLFLSVAVYRTLYPDAVEKASEKLNWMVAAINTLILQTSSLTMVLAVHSARLGRTAPRGADLGLTILLGVCFLAMKGFEYWTDYRDNLIPGWRFDNAEWLSAGLSEGQIPHVKLFLLLYWIMTGFHALHVTIGVGVMLVLLILVRRGMFTPAYYAPLDVAGLYWHFVDIVWTFLLPMLYLLGTHKLSDLHIL